MNGPDQLDVGHAVVAPLQLLVPTLPRGSGTPEELRRAVLEAPAHTSPKLRQAAAAGDAWGSYAATVRTASYILTDAVLESLKQEHTEDEIFEVTAAAAVGAALDHYNAARKTLGS